MSHTKIEVRIKKIHCGNTEDVTGGDELYFTSVLTDGSTEKTQAEIVGVIEINDNETKRPNALIYSAILPDDRTIRGGIQAFDEDTAKDWSKKPEWVASMKDVVVEGLTATGNPWAVGAGQVLKWGYEVVDTIIKADKDDKLGERKLEIPVSGSKQQTISWKFSKKGDFLGYSSWNYTVDLEILRTPTPVSDSVDKTGDTGRDGWRGVWTSGIDAALVHPNGKAYFFKGAEYQRFDFASNKVDKTGRTGRDGWKGVWNSGIDAALVHPNGKAYFFKGTEYRRFDFGSDQVDKTGRTGRDG